MVKQIRYIEPRIPYLLRSARIPTEQDFERAKRLIEWGKAIKEFREIGRNY